MKLFVYIALTALLACILSQTLKTLLNTIVRKRKFKLRNLASDGSYPSSHTTFITSVTTISWVYTIHNWVTVGASEVLMWCSVALTVFSIIVVRDAIGVRYTVQKLCDAVIKVSSNTEHEEEIKKILDVKSGHKPHEVIAGVILGILVATVSSLIYYGLYKYIPYAIIAFVIYVLLSIVIVKKSVKNTA